MAVPYAVSRGVSRGVPRSVTDRLFGGSTSAAALFLAQYGPYGMVMDFTDASISINDETDVLDYNSQGTISSTTGLPLGPRSKLTYSAPSLKFTEQADGYIAGQAHNLCLQSETFSVTWTNDGTTESLNATLAPNGTLTADEIIETAVTGGHGVQQTVANLVVGATYTFSARVKRGTVSRGFSALGTVGAGTGYSYFNLTTGATGTKLAAHTASRIESLENGWFLVSIDIVPTATSVTFFIISSAVDGTATFAGDVSYSMFYWGAHLRRTPSVSTYVATTSAAVYDLPYVYSGGVRTKILPEPAATNLALRSNDFTNASWTKSNLTAAMTATGPDNVANSASTLTATAGNATALQAITSGSSSRLTHCYIKRRTGSGNIDLTQDNGSTWTTQTVTSSWTRVSLATVTSANPTVGIRIVTSGDEVDVWCFQHETGTVVTSPIPTYAGAVLRAADSIALATSLWPYQQNLSILIEWSDGPQVNGRIASLYNAETIRYFDLHRPTSPNLSNYTNHTNGGYMPGVNPSDFTGAHKYAIRYEDSNSKSATDGTLGTVDADIVVDAVATVLAIGSYPAGSNGGVVGITRIAIVTRSWSDAELQAVST